MVTVRKAVDIAERETSLSVVIHVSREVWMDGWHLTVRGIQIRLLRNNPILQLRHIRRYPPTDEASTPSTPALHPLCHPNDSMRCESNGGREVRASHLDLDRTIAWSAQGQ